MLRQQFEFVAIGIGNQRKPSAARTQGADGLQDLDAASGESGDEGVDVVHGNADMPLRSHRCAGLGRFVPKFKLHRRAVCFRMTNENERARDFGEVQATDFAQTEMLRIERQRAFEVGDPQHGMQQLGARR